MSEGTNWMPRYVYGSFCVRVGKFLDLYGMFCDWINALKVLGVNFDLFRHPVIAHLARFKSICAHSEIFCSLVI